jgi:hypothetical protein
MFKEIAAENKRVRIEQSDIGYLVTFYMDNRLMNKSNVHSLHEANELADKFIDDNISPTLLNEAS